MIENTGRKSKRQLPIAKREDVEFAVELADSEDIEALERADKADYRQEDGISDARKTISAYFKSENDAEGAALKLKSLRMSDVRVERMGDYAGDVNDRAIVPIDSAFLMIGGTALGGGLANSTVGATATGAAGVGLFAMIKGQNNSG